MTRMTARLRSVMNALFRRDRFEDAMSEELRFHLDAYAADLERAGVPPAEAQRRARMAFGNIDVVKQDARQSRGLRLIDETWQDLRYSIRLMRKTPAFTAAAVLSLGLGIGANTAIFSLIDAVLLRTLPVENPHELFFLAHDSAEVPSTSSNYPLYERYREAQVFSGVTAYRTLLLKVHAGESIELVPGQYVSGNYHEIVQAPMLRGRGFVNESDRPGDPPVAVISESVLDAEIRPRGGCARKDGLDSRHAGADRRRHSCRFHRPGPRCAGRHHAAARDVCC